MTSPQIEWAPASDTIYLLFRDVPVSYSVELAPDIIADLDSDNVVVGLDVQNVMKVLQEQGQSTLSAPLKDKKLQLVPA